MKKKSKTFKIIRMVVLDILMLGALLLLFAYFHHARIEEIVPQEIVSAVTPTPEPTATPEPTREPEKNETDISVTPEQTEATPEPFFDMNGLLKGKYVEKFTAEKNLGESSYTSKNISLTVTTRDDYGCKVHVADIYVNDINCFRTAVYSEFDKRYMSTLDMANAAGAIVAVSGDHFYAHRQAGVFAVRNGMVYGDNPKKNQDVCALYKDGTMEVLKGGSYNIQAVYNKDPWQIWCFGPGLLDENGKALKNINSTVAEVNPRSSVGYFEPGHYCFIMVEGRSKESPGVTLDQLAQIYEDLGCKVAYNLDGGQTAVMTFNGMGWSKLLGNGREVSDILYIKDLEG